METNWDLHKENVQPLPQGRKLSELNRFLATEPNSDEIKKREETRTKFEDLLRCESEDKLAIWYDYINWVEQNYPEGGEEANLKKLIENCISDLFNVTKYHQDERFFRIFLRYTRIVTDALELFNIMSSSNIFTSIAGFYINWANLVEKNISKAEEIIRTGLEKFAKPTIQLELALKEIQLIASEQTHNGHSDDEDVRKPFVPLKVEKKKSGKTLAPIERLANYEQSNYKLSSAANQQQTNANNNQKNSKIQIFNDENGDATGHQQEIVKKLPTSNNQENMSKAGRWCDNKIKSKPRLDLPEVVKFEIQEDSPAESKTNYDADLKSRQANKLKEIKKDDRDKSPRLVIFEKLAPNQRFYCDLKKIYCGGTEYSFEEIRSIRLKLARKKEEERLTKEQLMREVQDLKKQISAKDNLVNHVEQMKKKLEQLMKLNSRFNLNDVDVKSGESSAISNSLADLKRADPIEQHCTSEKQAKFDVNLLAKQGNDAVSRLDKSLTKNSVKSSTNCDAKVINQFSKNSPQQQQNDENDDRSNNKIHQQNSPPQPPPPTYRRDFKEDLTIVRDLWNGSIDDEQTVDIENECIQKPKAGDFTIFKDDENITCNRLNEFNPQHQSINFQTDDTNTFALPSGDFDFIAKHASTPASHLHQQFQTTIDENCTMNVYQNRDNNKLLSPIVETSKEYKSSSSSSLLSGFSSYQKSKTFHK